MTRLAWDQTTERRYETGTDHGVLYLSDSSGVAWPGLTSVEEDFSSETTNPLYFDGVKYLDEPTFGDYAATLSAYTYPLEFLEYEGMADMGDGILADGQQPKPFGLSYRTLVGDFAKGVDAGYQIHIVYGVTAVPSSKSRGTISENPEMLEFSWQLNAVPQFVYGYRPTAHVILDNTLLPPLIMGRIEDILYGNEENEPHLPTIEELIGALVVIIDNGDGTYTAIGPDSAVHLLAPTLFEIKSSVATVTGPDTYILSSP